MAVANSAKRLPDVDAPGTAFRGLGDDDGQNSVTEVGGDSFGVDSRRQRKRSRKLAVSAFDLVVLLARDASIATALQDDSAVVNFDADLVAGQPWQFGRNNEGVGGFTEVDGWHPPLWARRQPLETVLDGQQVAQWVPASESHVSDSSTGLGR